MKSASSLKRNYFRRPAIRQLVPDLKLLLCVLQVSCESHVGCWVPSGISDDCGLSLEALEGGMRNLQKNGFILIDVATGEIFLTDFFRNNAFKGPMRMQQALGDFRQIESETLRNRVVEAVRKSPECGLNSDLFSEKQLNQRLKNQEQDQEQDQEKNNNVVVGFDLPETLAGFENVVESALSANSLNKEQMQQLLSDLARFVQAGKVKNPGGWIASMAKLMAEGKYLAQPQPTLKRNNSFHIAPAPSRSFSPPGSALDALRGGRANG